ncbi:hypothetical protein ACI7YT_01730 [Microbacterium sp. M]|uniref:hypothetical protein n=1 Tax=Microbacterium sp. M TaxID=3377125 RepID=UPI0038686505
MEWLWIALGVVGVIILFVGLGKTMRPTVPPTPTPMATTADTAADIDRLVAEGNKIRAIKLLRDSTPGLTLQEAKNRIDAWSPTTPATTAIPKVPAAASALPPEAIAEIDALIASERRIEAIKLLRAHTGWGLKESKDRIDGWTPGQTGSHL